MRAEGRQNIVSRATAVGAGIGFFAGVAAQAGRTRGSDYDFSVLAVPLLTGVGAFAGFGLGLALKVIGVVIDKCTVERDNAVRARVN